MRADQDRKESILAAQAQVSAAAEAKSRYEAELAALKQAHEAELSTLRAQHESQLSEVQEASAHAQRQRDSMLSARSAAGRSEVSAASHDASVTGSSEGDAGSASHEVDGPPSSKPVYMPAGLTTPRVVACPFTVLRYKLQQALLLLKSYQDQLISLKVRSRCQPRRHGLAAIGLGTVLTLCRTLFSIASEHWIRARRNVMPHKQRVRHWATLLLAR